MGEFLLFKKNKDNKSYSLRGLKTLKELKKAFWRHTQICEENNLCQLLFQTI